MKPIDEVQAVNQVVNRLSAHFATFAPEEVAEIVRECHSQFAGSPIRDFVPLLVERTARDRLRAMAPIAPENSTPDRPRPAPVPSSLLQLAFGDGKAWVIL
jgi:hypothetical protein